MHRRKFLKSVAGGGTAAFMPWAVSARVQMRNGPIPQGYKALTAEQVATLEAICEQIVPADEFPGAKQAGVVHFIDQVLTGPVARSYRKRYEVGLKLVDRVSQGRHGQGFAALEGEQQRSVLLDLESGKAAGAAGQQFFALLVGHTMEGYYGDPAHGGNRDGASWKMIGFKG